MGGTNQSTCPPATFSNSITRWPRGNNMKSPGPIGAALNPIRFHEDPSRGEVDFHDDHAGFKCAVDSAAFFSAYTPWRSRMSEEMTLSGQLIKTGENKPSGHASVTFLPYVDDAGELQVGMIVAEAKMGKTILDLDKLAHFS